MDEFNEHRLRKKGFSETVIKTVDAIPLEQQQAYITALAKMTTAQIKNINGRYKET